MIKDYKFSDLINDSSDIKSYEGKSVLYRIINLSNNKNYIGTSKNDLYDRLNNSEYGHITNYKNSSYKCSNMYIDMNKNLENFLFIIEEIMDYNEYNYNHILDLETLYIKKFDSVLNGYNVSKDGKPGWKTGSVCVHKGKTDYYIDPIDVPRFIRNGYILGRHDQGESFFLRGRVFVNDGENDRMIYPEELDEFICKGYSLGRIHSPNKNKVWRNNGVKSKLINIDELNSNKFSEFIYSGRIEPPRKPRGPYNKEKKKKVNNGKIEIGIPISKLDEFLKSNPEYKIGRLNNKRIIVTNDKLGVTKYTDSSDLPRYLNSGYRIGRKRKNL